RRYGDRIRVIRQANGGHAGALNRAIAEARCDYVAKCDADDIWVPEKLARQVDALRDHPQLDVLFGAARFFGSVEGPYGIDPGDGILDRTDLARRLYAGNFACASTVMMRRALWQRLGPFDGDIACEDYEYWLRALADDAVFHYDPHVLVHYRRHDAQLTHRLLRMHRAAHQVRLTYVDLVDDERLVSTVLAGDLATMARLYAAEGDTASARASFVASLRRRPSGFALAWLLLLAAPQRWQQSLASAGASLRRSVPGRFQAAVR
ncbi:MAG TPA: glycosyltransferase, partial [Thermoleophilia bacterium]